jgi:hypothetical protein
MRDLDRQIFQLAIPAFGVGATVVALGWWLFLRALSLWLRLNFLTKTNWRLLV